MVDTVAKIVIKHGLEAYLQENRGVEKDKRTGAKRGGRMLLIFDADTDRKDYNSVKT